MTIEEVLAKQLAVAVEQTSALLRIASAIEMLALTNSKDKAEKPEAKSDKAKTGKQSKAKKDKAEKPEAIEYAVIKAAALHLAQLGGRKALIAVLEEHDLKTASAATAEQYPALLTSLEKALKEVE